MHTYKNREFDILDAILIIIENWKLIVIPPIVIGALFFAIFSAWPKVYASSSTLQMDEANSGFTAPLAASLAISHDTLSRLEHFAHASQSGSAEKIYRDLKKRIQISIGKQDGLLHIKTQASSPHDAQNFNQSLIDLIFTLSKPQPIEKSRLELQLKNEKDRLTASLNMEQLIISRLGSSNGVNEATSRLYGELMSSNSARYQDILDIEHRLIGLGAENIIQSPSLPEKAIEKQKILATAVAVIGSALFLLFFVFFRQALRVARENFAEQARKISRIRQALPW